MKTLKNNFVIKNNFIWTEIIMNLSLIKIPFGMNFQGKKEKELLVTASQKLFGVWVMENEIGFVGHA